MTTKIEKTLIGLLVIVVIVSAGTLVYMTQLLSLSGKVDDLLAKVTSINDGLASKELFPGENELYLKAKQEGGLVMYSVGSTQELVSFLAKFSTRYPGISTTYWQATTSQIVAKVLAEHEGNQPKVDVLGTDTVPIILRGMGLMMNYTTVQFDQCIVKDSNMPVNRLAVYILYYNPTKMKNLGLPIPKNWEDIINPIYKGQVCLDDPLRGAGLDVVLATLKQRWNNQTRFTNFVAGLKALDVPVYQSSGAELQLVVAGEYALGFVGQGQDASREMAKGSPIDFVRTVDPVIVSPSYYGIFSEAPHPNAAKLFNEWLLTVEGQLAFSDLMLTPNRIGVPSATSVEALYPGGNVTVVPDDFQANRTLWVEQNVKPIWSP